MFDCSSLLVLVLDEADCILDLGFEKTVRAPPPSLSLSAHSAETRAPPLHCAHRAE